MSNWAYIASHCKDLANEYAEILESAGFYVCSSWHTKEFLPTGSHTFKERLDIAEEDLQDIQRCDYLFLVSGPDKYSGGKFVEAGIAYGMGKKVYVIGRRENMLTYLFEKVDSKDLAQ